jgi:hypothetical protein
MRFTVLVLSVSLVAFALPEAHAADKSLAAALGASAAKLAGDGKTDKAKELCYKALANDEDCPEALYELGKIFEKEGKATAAGDFLFRAARQFAKDEGANPTFASKRLDAERRVKSLNPYATRYAEAMTEYSMSLGTITKKTPDSMTAEEALDRVTILQLANVVPPEKLPNIEKPALKTPEKTVKHVIDDEGFIRTVKKEVVNSIPPDVERALKANGWATVTGTWKKKEGAVYEVTDGKLETPKTNGALQILVPKGNTGKIRIMVRDKPTSSGGIVYSSSYSSTGYGFMVEGAVAKLYSASGGYFYSTSSGIYRPYFERDIALPLPKNKILIQITGGKLEMYVNDKREHNSNYKLNPDGPFVIEVDGTCTIEDPRAAGQ